MSECEHYRAMRERRAREGVASPTDGLVREHAVIGLVVAAMEREAAHIRETGELDGDRIERMLEFTRHFTDGWHHDKEERLLFPVMERLDERGRAQVAVMLQEHDGARRRVANIVGALEAARAGDAAARRTVADNLSGYASLLFAHIAKENNVIFPLADRLLGTEERNDLAAEFAQVDAQAGALHERYEAEARELAGC
jgi:hemerythrin-like domain-containing protein